MVKATKGFGHQQQSDTEKKSIEAEIQQLQRNFRVLENDKRNYSEVSQGVIRKQRATIVKLTRDNKKMKQEVSETRAFTSSRSEHKIGTEKLQRMQEEKDRIDTRLKDEISRGELIDDRLEVLQKKIYSLREELARRGGVNAAKETNEALDKQIKILDNRLENNLQKFNEQVIAVNTNLRDEIDSLRRERVVFDSIYRKLEIELQEKKKEMANIIEQANAAYEARDQAQAQMTALKQQADREHIEFEKEWKELGRLIENDKKMKEFMRQREKARIEDSSGKHGSDGADIAMRGDLSLNDENKIRKKVTQSAWGIAKDKANIQSTSEKVQVYEEAFGKIQTATGISDIDELVENFIAAEDQNFSLFNYANQLSGDIKKLEASFNELKEEYDTLKGGGGSGSVPTRSNNKHKDNKTTTTTTTDMGKQKLLSELEERWSSVDKKAEFYELKYQQAMKTLTSVRAGIQSIFNRLGCDPPPLAAIVDTQSSSSIPQAAASGGGNDSGSGLVSSVSESVMLPFLGVIEKKANEILQLYAASQIAAASSSSSADPGATEGGGGGGEGGLAAADYEVGDKYLMPKATATLQGGGGGGQHSSSAQAFMTIKLPSTVEDYSDDEDDDEDDDQRPYTREELKARSIRDIARRKEKQKKNASKDLATTNGAK